MEQTEIIMGMPIRLIVPDEAAGQKVRKTIFDFFRRIDNEYSPYKSESLVGRINRRALDEAAYPSELRTILAEVERTKHETDGYFDCWHDGVFDPSGIVKGWALQQAAGKLSDVTADYYIEAGGDVQVKGRNAAGRAWRVGIRNPFNHEEIIARVALDDHGIATSGTAIRGDHIYNPRAADRQTDLLSLTVIAKQIHDADRFATAAFAMGREGMRFIQRRAGLEAYAVTHEKKVIMTTGWRQYEVDDEIR